MEFTYQVMGTDGKTYGPVTLEELKGWINQGRVDASTQISRSDLMTWVPAANHPELGLAMAGPAQMVAGHLPIPGKQAAAQTVQPGLDRQIKNGAGWFYWIAGLSLVNSIAAFTGAGWSFFIGMGVTYLAVAVAGEGLGFALAVAACGIFAAFGFFAGKHHRWAFITGMVMYALDGLIFLLYHDWLSLGFHVFALYYMFRGLQGVNEISRA